MNAWQPGIRAVRAGSRSGRQQETQISVRSIAAPAPCCVAGRQAAAIGTEMS